MEIRLEGHDARYDVQSVCQLFFPGVSFGTDDGRELTSCFDASLRVAAAYYRRGDRTFYVRDAGVPSVQDSDLAKIKRSVYRVLCEATGLSSPWGILTGIKPAVYYDRLRCTIGDGADELFRDCLGVQPEKIELCREVARGRVAAVSLLSPRRISLYISIPFCPSKCRYCSFVSSCTEREGKYVEPYLEALKQEIVAKSAFARRRGYEIVSVYIGGGTPGILTPEQTDGLLKTLFAEADLSLLREFTFEAGRPDVITAPKLDVLRTYGIGRICVNPQTLSDKVLYAVGRRHTAEQFYEAYNLASRKGFSINVDTIAGLPEETPESFADTYRRLTALDPDNLTLHSLYIKRAGELPVEDFDALKKQTEQTGEMVRFAEGLCRNSGYIPYYLYRQKSTVGNHENVGYARPGKECLYNIFMMDDVQTVLALGAGAVSKFVRKGQNPVRIGNSKFAYNYIKELEQDLEKFDRAAGQVEI